MRYLSSFTYLNSAPLLTYAGLVCFYLAQPASARGGSATDNANGTKNARHDPRESGSEANSTRSRSMSDASAPPNAEMLRQAREWFAKALKVDPHMTVAREFMHLIDGPRKETTDDEMDVDSLDGERGKRTPSQFSIDSGTARAAWWSGVHEHDDDKKDEYREADDKGQSDEDDKDDDDKDDDGKWEESDDTSEDKWDEEDRTGYGRDEDADADLWQLHRRRRSSTASL
ncbi:unnamed protein product [Cutaneotrichosporon oleaginosum]